MDIILNSKFFSSFSITDLGLKVAELGYDGIDINIREGHPINPSNVLETLPKAANLWAELGLSCPLATAPVDMVDPEWPGVRALYEACAEAGVPRLKIGFWRFARGDDYWSAVSRARDALSRFHLLSETFGVQTCYQVHSGSILGSNCAGVMHLIRGFDPTFIGAYPDIGHMALDGEDWDMGFAMLGKHLSVIGAKDAYHAPQPKRSTPPYLPKFVKLGDGSVDWARCMQAIVALGFDGPISVHTEYDFDETVIRKVGYAESAPPNLYKWAKEDVRFLKHMTHL